MRGGKSMWYMDVAERLRGLDGSGYPRYGFLRGLGIRYGFGLAVFTRVQGDPHAPPSWLEIRVPRSTHGLPARLMRRDEAVATLDYVARALYDAVRGASRRCGSGYSCVLAAPRPGPWVLRRSMAVFEHDTLVLRFSAGLPARGRRILGGEAAWLVEKALPRVAENVLSALGERERLEEHVELYLDQVYLRGWLRSRGYVAFVADGSILPRETGYTDKPMRGAKPFRAPSGMSAVVELPSGRRIRGLAMPRGLIMVTGGGFHGKTTLLEALQEGVYSHVAGDGREYVMTVEKAFTVKAEDGRPVACVDISSHVSGLPGGGDTTCFSTLDASGSTSMAASISEAIELGAELLFFDEDTSATNLLYKDQVMEKLIRREPIRPLYHQLRSLYEKTGCSVVGVVSASSMYIPVADHVILMEEYLPRVVTEEAKNLASPMEPRSEEYRVPHSRVFTGIDGLVEAKAKGFRITIRYRRHPDYELILDNNPRIVEKGQVRLAAKLVEWIDKHMRGRTMREIAEEINRLMKTRGFNTFYHTIPPDLTEIMGEDVVWIINRIPHLMVEQRTSSTR